jgi:hypothetical protein
MGAEKEIFSPNRTAKQKSKEFAQNVILQLTKS